MTVEASGKNFDLPTVFSRPTARDRDRDRISYPDGDGIEVEGYVAEFVSISSDFKVSGQMVNAANAVIKNGSAADIRNGLKVEAEGTMSNGVLVASVLVIKQLASIRVEAGLQAVDATLNTVTMLGRSIKVNADTDLRDGVANPGQPTAITLGALNPADRLEVKVYKDVAGALVATRVERTAADSLVVVKGPADAKVPTTQLTLAGFGVSTGLKTRYRDASGAVVDAVSSITRCWFHPRCRRSCMRVVWLLTCRSTSSMPRARTANWRLGANERAKGPDRAGSGRHRPAEVGRRSRWPPIPCWRRPMWPRATQ